MDDKQRYEYIRKLWHVPMSDRMINDRDIDWLIEKVDEYLNGGDSYGKTE